MQRTQKRPTRKWGIQVGLVPRQQAPRFTRLAERLTFAAQPLTSIPRTLDSDPCGGNSSPRCPGPWCRPGCAWRSMLESCGDKRQSRS